MEMHFHHAYNSTLHEIKHNQEIIHHL